MNNISAKLESSLVKIHRIVDGLETQSTNLNALHKLLSYVKFLPENELFVFDHAAIGRHKGIALIYENPKSEEAIQIEFVFNDGIFWPNLFLTSTENEYEIELSPNIELLPKIALAEKPAPSVFDSYEGSLVEQHFYVDEDKSSKLDFSQQLTLVAA